MGTSADDFFKHLEESTVHGKTLPAWHGELYLEFHRGTYTSHGKLVLYAVGFRLLRMC